MNLAVSQTQPKKPSQSFPQHDIFDYFLTILEKIHNHVDDINQTNINDIFHSFNFPLRCDVTHHNHPNQIEFCNLFDFFHQISKIPVPIPLPLLPPHRSQTHSDHPTPSQNPSQCRIDRNNHDSDQYHTHINRIQLSSLFHVPHSPNQRQNFCFLTLLQYVTYTKRLNWVKFFLQLSSMHNKPNVRCCVVNLFKSHTTTLTSTATAHHAVFVNQSSRHDNAQHEGDVAQIFNTAILLGLSYAPNGSDYMPYPYIETCIDRCPPNQSTNEPHNQLHRQPPRRDTPQITVPTTPPNTPSTPNHSQTRQQFHSTPQTPQIVAKITNQATVSVTFPFQTTPHPLTSHLTSINIYGCYYSPFEIGLLSNDDELLDCFFSLYQNNNQFLHHIGGESSQIIEQTPLPVQLSSFSPYVMNADQVLSTNCTSNDIHKIQSPVIAPEIDPHHVQPPMAGFESRLLIDNGNDIDTRVLSPILSSPMSTPKASTFQFKAQITPINVLQNCTNTNTLDNYTLQPHLFNTINGKDFITIACQGGSKSLLKCLNVLQIALQSSHHATSGAKILSFPFQCDFFGFDCLYWLCSSFHAKYNKALNMTTTSPLSSSTHQTITKSDRAISNTQRRSIRHDFVAMFVLLFEKFSFSILFPQIMVPMKKCANNTHDNNNSITSGRHNSQSNQPDHCYTVTTGYNQYEYNAVLGTNQQHEQNSENNHPSAQNAQINVSLPFHLILAENYYALYVLLTTINTNLHNKNQTLTSITLILLQQWLNSTVPIQLFTPFALHTETTNDPASKGVKKVNDFQTNTQFSPSSSPLSGTQSNPVQYQALSTVSHLSAGLISPLLGPFGDLIDLSSNIDSNNTSTSSKSPNHPEQIQREYKYRLRSSSHKVFTFDEFVASQSPQTSTPSSPYYTVPVSAPSPPMTPLETMREMGSNQCGVVNGGCTLVDLLRAIVNTVNSHQHDGNKGHVQEDCAGDHSERDLKNDVVQFPKNNKKISPKHPPFTTTSCRYSSTTLECIHQGISLIGSIQKKIISLAETFTKCEKNGKTEQTEKLENNTQISSSRSIPDTPIQLVALYHDLHYIIPPNFTDMTRTIQPLFGLQPVTGKTDHSDSNNAGWDTNMASMDQIYSGDNLAHHGTETTMNNNQNNTSSSHHEIATIDKVLSLSSLPSPSVSLSPSNTVSTPQHTNFNPIKDRLTLFSFDNSPRSLLAPNHSKSPNTHPNMNDTLTINDLQCVKSHYDSVIRYLSYYYPIQYSFTPSFHIRHAAVMNNIMSTHQYSSLISTDSTGTSGGVKSAHKCPILCTRSPQKSSKCSDSCPECPLETNSYPKDSHLLRTQTPDLDLDQFCDQTVEYSPEPLPSDSLCSPDDDFDVILVKGDESDLIGVCAGGEPSLNDYCDAFHLMVTKINQIQPNSAFNYQYTPPVRLQKPMGPGEGPKTDLKCQNNSNLDLYHQNLQPQKAKLSTLCPFLPLSSPIYHLHPFSSEQQLQYTKPIHSHDGSSDPYITMNDDSNPPQSPSPLLTATKPIPSRTRSLLTPNLLAATDIIDKSSRSRSPPTLSLRNTDRNGFQSGNNAGVNSHNGVGGVSSAQSVFNRPNGNSFVSKLDTLNSHKDVPTGPNNVEWAQTTPITNVGKLHTGRAQLSNNLKTTPNQFYRNSPSNTHHTSSQNSDDERDDDHGDEYKHNNHHVGERVSSSSSSTPLQIHSLTRSRSITSTSTPQSIPDQQHSRNQDRIDRLDSAKQTNSIHFIYDFILQQRQIDNWIHNQQMIERSANPFTANRSKSVYCSISSNEPVQYETCFGTINPNGKDFRYAHLPPKSSRSNAAKQHQK